MEAPPPARFERLLASLDREAFVRFVAALWAARGWTTRIEGETVVATDGTGERRRLRCLGGQRLRDRLPRLPWSVPLPGIGDRRDDPPSAARGDPSREMDVVVAARDAARARRLARAVGATFRGPEALRAALFYGLAREDARRLCLEHFDRDPTAGDGTADRGSVRDRLRAAPRPAAAAVAVLIAAAVVSIAAVTVLGGPTAGAAGADVPALGSSAPGSGEAPGSGSGSGSGTGAGFSSGSGDDAGGPSPSEGSAGGVWTGERAHPPGVSADGVEDVDELARAHAARVSERSYYWHVRHHDVPRRPGSPTGWTQASRTVRVENASRYSSELGGAPRQDGAGQWIEYREYADGEHVYYRYSGGGEVLYDRKPLPPVADEGGPMTILAKTYVRGYLDASDSAIEAVQGDEGLRFRVVAAGEPRRAAANATNYTATAIVRPSGFVESLTVEYDYPDADRTARFSFEYSLDDGVHVAEPNWYETARDETVR